MLNYLKINTCDVANGVGIRVVLWVAGCEHHCEGCQNPETWGYVQGNQFTEETYKYISQFLAKPYISGITFSGGDPLGLGNRNDVLKLACRIKEEFPSKSIWCYTGYTWEDVYMLSDIDCIDVLVDGEYQQELRNVSLPWCGSENQRVIDVKTSLLLTKHSEKPEIAILL